MRFFSPFQADRKPIRKTVRQAKGWRFWLPAASAARAEGCGVFQPATQSWGRTPAKNSLFVGWGFSLGVAGFGHPLLRFHGGGGCFVLWYRLTFGICWSGYYPTGLAIRAVLEF